MPLALACTIHEAGRLTVMAHVLSADSVWIGYTQSDSFAAAVDRFLARTAEMLSRLVA